MVLGSVARNLGFATQPFVPTFQRGVRTAPTFGTLIGPRGGAQQGLGGMIAQQLRGVLGGLPEAFQPEQFLAGLTAAQVPALAGARQSLEAQLAARGLTGTGAEIGALTGLESQAATSRSRALSDFLLQRPGLQLGALGQATDILRGLRRPRVGGGGGISPRAGQRQRAEERFLESLAPGEALEFLGQLGAPRGFPGLFDPGEPQPRRRARPLGPAVPFGPQQPLAPGEAFSGARLF